MRIERPVIPRTDRFGVCQSYSRSYYFTFTLLHFVTSLLLHFLGLFHYIYSHIFLPQLVLYIYPSHWNRLLISRMFGSDAERAIWCIVYLIFSQRYEYWCFFLFFSLRRVAFGNRGGQSISPPRSVFLALKLIFSVCLYAFAGGRSWCGDSVIETNCNSITYTCPTPEKLCYVHPRSAWTVAYIYILRKRIRTAVNLILKQWNLRH